jgi:hypothetical protein
VKQCRFEITVAGLLTENQNRWPTINVVCTDSLFGVRIVFWGDSLLRTRKVNRSSLWATQILRNWEQNRCSGEKSAEWMVRTWFDRSSDSFQHRIKHLRPSTVDLECALFEPMGKANRWELKLQQLSWWGSRNSKKEEKTVCTLCSANCCNLKVGLIAAGMESSIFWSHFRVCE